VIVTRDEPTVEQKRFLSKKGHDRPILNTDGEDLEELNRAWLIVRYMKSCYGPDHSIANRFTLRGGERIKVGRIIFIVKELVTDTIQYYGTPSLKEVSAPYDENNSDSSEAEHESGLEHEAMRLTDDGQHYD
jgi:hypothetical protein